MPSNIPANQYFTLDSGIDSTTTSFLDNLIDNAGLAVAPQARPKAPMSSEILSKKIRELYKIAPPVRLDPELAEHFFGEQGVSFPTLPYPFEDEKSLIGIEVEVENLLRIDPNVLLLVWNMVEDHSLRNNGREFKTRATPIRFVEQALRLLFNGINDSVDFSVRTSIHVHQDVRGLPLSALLGLLYTYVCFESLFFKFAGTSRKNSIYCVPILQTELFSHLEKASSLSRNLTRLADWWPKYSAFNLQPVASFGTIEYRHLPGTSNIGKILTWIDLISRLKIWVYKNSLEEITNQISDLNTNSQYRHFLENVFGSSSGFLDSSDLLHDMEEGVTAVRNCVITNHFSQNLKLDKSSPLAFACGLAPMECLLSKEQLKAFNAFHKRWWSNENPERLYQAVKLRVEEYARHAGEEGAALLRIVYPEQFN